MDDDELRNDGAPPLEEDKVWWMINARLWEAEMPDRDS